MKQLALIAVLVLRFLQSEFAFYEEHYSCVSQSGQTIVTIDAVNRPDLEMEGFDSAAPVAVEDVATVNVRTKMNRKRVAARVKVISITEGVGSSMLHKAEDGSTCNVGINTVGIKMLAEVTVSGKARNLKFNCTNKTQFPDAAIECK